MGWGEYYTIKGITYDFRKEDLSIDDKYEPEVFYFYIKRVFESSHVSSELFIYYLHQNYPMFFSDLEQIISSSEHLSFADSLLNFEV